MATRYLTTLYQSMQDYVKIVKENWPVLSIISDTNTNIIIHLYLIFDMKNTDLIYQTLRK